MGVIFQIQKDKPLYLLELETVFFFISTEIHIYLFQTLKLKTILKGDAPTSQINTDILKREVSDLYKHRVRQNNITD